MDRPTQTMAQRRLHLDSDRRNNRRDPKFAEAERALADRGAKAWAERAPNGVGPETLKEIIAIKVKNAWNR